MGGEEKNDLEVESYQKRGPGEETIYLSSLFLRECCQFFLDVFRKCLQQQLFGSEVIATLVLLKTLIRSGCVGHLSITDQVRFSVPLGPGTLKG